MPVDLNDVLNDVRWVDVNWGEAVFKIGYRPSATSMRRQAELGRLQREASASKDEDELEMFRRVASIVCTVITDWDLTRGGQPLAVNVDAVLDLPREMYQAIMDAITDDRQSQQNEKKASNATSAVTSQRVDRLVTAQNGIPSSVPHDTWA